MKSSGYKIDRYIADILKNNYNPLSKEKLSGETGISLIEEIKSMRPGHNFVLTAIKTLDNESRINDFFNAYIEYLDKNGHSDPYTTARQNIAGILEYDRKNLERKAGKIEKIWRKSKAEDYELITTFEKIDNCYKRQELWQKAIPELFID